MIDKILSKYLTVDVLRISDGKVFFYQNPNDDKKRADSFRKACKEAIEGDVIHLGPGKFDMDGKNKGQVWLPNKVHIKGSGMDFTHLYSDVHSDAQGSAFRVRNSIVSDLTMENQSWHDNEDGRCVGFDVSCLWDPKKPGYYLKGNEHGGTVTDPIQPPVFSVKLHRCKIISNDWAIYNWITGSKLEMKDCEVVSGRQGLSAMNSNDQSFDIYRCKFTVDARLSKSVGSTSNKKIGGVYGAICRAGYLRMIDCEFHLYGKANPYPHSYAPRCIGIYDAPDYGGKYVPKTKFEIMNPRFYVEPNDAPEVFDIKMGYKENQKRFRLLGGWGSGPNGKITKSWS